MNKSLWASIVLGFFFLSGCGSSTSTSSSSDSSTQAYTGYTQSYLFLEPAKTSLLAGSLETFSLYKYTSGSTIESTVTLVEPTWSLAGNIGNLTQNGTFTATREGIGYVITSYEGTVKYITLIVTSESLKTTPAIPSGLMISTVSSNIALISWNPSTNASSYDIRYNTNQLTYNGHYTYSDNSSILLTNLSPNTTYYIQVSAANNYGDSRYCAAEIFTTIP